MPRTVIKLAEQVLGRAQNVNSINGRNPATLASAAIYLAALHTSNSRSFEDISRICGAAVTTIKQTSKVLTPNVGDLLPPLTHVKSAPVLIVKN